MLIPDTLAEESRIGAQIATAAAHRLPFDWRLVLTVERQTIEAELLDPHGNTVEYSGAGQPVGAELDRLIATAQAAAAGDAGAR